MIDQPIQFVSANENIVFGESEQLSDARATPPAGLPSGSIANLVEAEQLLAYASSTVSQVEALTDGIYQTVLAVAEGGVTDRAQIASRQIQMDSYIRAIELAVSSATVSLGGRQSTSLLSGYYDICHTAGSVSQVVGCQVFRADLGPTGDKSIQVELTQCATRPTITLDAAAVDNGLSADVAFELVGLRGTETFTFQKGTSASHIVAMANLLSDRTGTVARLHKDGGIEFSGEEFGSKSFIQVSVISEPQQGQFSRNLSAERAVGTDTQGNINGVPANSAGHNLWLRTATLDVAIVLSPTSTSSFAFKVTGGGVQIESQPMRARIGLPSLLPSQLGGPNGRLYELASGQAKSLEADHLGAVQVASEVRRTVAELQYRLAELQDNLNQLSHSPHGSAAELADGHFDFRSSILTPFDFETQTTTSTETRSDSRTTNPEPAFADSKHPGSTPHPHTFQPHVRGVASKGDSLPENAHASVAFEQPTAGGQQTTARRTIVPQLTAAEERKRRSRLQSQRIVVTPGPSVLQFADPSTEEIFLRR